MSTLIISGSRADRGALAPVQQALNGEWLNLDLPHSHTGYDSAESCSVAMSLTAERLHRTPPEMVVVVGDRYEILGAATAAHLLSIPIAHLSGGDLTEGSQDDGMRHAITKLAHLHFPTNTESAARIIQMGEEPWRVHTVGCPAIDSLLATSYFDRLYIQHKLGVTKPYYLVAYQPATLAENPLAEVGELLTALRALGGTCVFTTANTDAGGIEIERKFSQFCLEGLGVMLEMDRQLYLSAMKHCVMMIGNSSSGLYEAPSLKIPFVNVGNRQKGRLQATSVVNCDGKASQIIWAVQQAQTLDCSKTVNPYGDGHAAERIKAVLQSPNLARQRLLVKQWGTQWHSIESGSTSTENKPGGPTLVKLWSDGPSVPNGHLSPLDY